METPFGPSEEIPGDIDVNAIAEDAMQAAFALIATRLELATGMHVFGDIDPLASVWIEEQFRGYVRSMMLNVSDSVEAKAKTLMVATFDVSGLPDEEMFSLAGEVSVQAEESDFVGDDGHGHVGHRSVPEPKITFSTEFPEKKREEN